jgi:Met-zincin/Domain of unknown function (DUF5117)/Domain of unknown function (DUF5118)
MKRLSAPIFIFHSMLFTIFFAGARLPASASNQLPVNRDRTPVPTLDSRLPTAPVSLPDSKVWVIKNNRQQPELQPYIWLANNQRQDARQSTLLLAQDSNQMAIAKDPKPSELKGFNEVIKNSSVVKGLFNFYRQKDTGKIYLEIQPQQLNKNFLSTMTMEAGIGERGIYSGMPLQDFLFYFRRVNNNIHFVVRNVNFRVTPGSPQTRSLMRSFSDSVLYSIPIKSIHPQRKTILIDLGDLLLKDLPGLAASLSTQLGTTYQLDENKSYFGSAKGFPLNMEIESVYGFSYGGAKSSATPNLMTLPDSRALTLRIRYSLSELAANSTYKPRLADDRIGYFITAYQDFAIEDRKEPFVRYINRWHLEKQNPNAKLSPAKKPIVFWIENAVPLEYRDAVKEGVLMWNKAFEKAGFVNAIEVRQMPDDAKWDPADVRYNVIRWINTVDGFFALGPSRVNPITGEILDADILVDASFVRVLKQEYRRMVQDSRSQPTSVLSQMMNDRSVCTSGFGQGGQGDKETRGQGEEPPTPDSPLQYGRTAARPYDSQLSKLATEYDLCYGMEAANQFDFGSLALTLFQNTTPNSDKMQQYIHQYLRLIIAHEVGHTLGLRHNFRGSTQLPPNELNATKITRDRGLTTSVMDYLPPNLSPPNREQGDFFPNSVGSYDEWAIEYGYTPTTAAHPLAERRFLDSIGDRSSRPDLAYATDEDRFDLDPDVNAWDYSSDVLQYSQGQLDIARAMWKKLNRRYPTTGESYSDLSELFDRIFLHYMRHTYYATKYIGGQSFYRDRASADNSRLPFVPVPVAKQRQALAVLEKYVFAPDAFNFPPELLNKLAPSRWMHWGEQAVMNRLDYPIHDSIYTLQSLVLRDLLSGDRLSRLRDIELKSQPKQALTLPELFTTLQNDIWMEVLNPDKTPTNISSLRRAVQREHLKIMTDMMLRKSNVPEDARTLAWYNLRRLREKLNKAVARSGKLDEYTQAHLAETRDRIAKTLDARVESR